MQGLLLPEVVNDITGSIEPTVSPELTHNESFFVLALFHIGSPSKLFCSLKLTPYEVVVRDLSILV